MRRSPFSLAWPLCIWLVVGLSSLGAARADESAVVPGGDVILRNFSAVERAGWITSPHSALSSSGVTRYEFALQTAAAIFLVSARMESDPTWAQGVSSTSFAALQNLTISLRAELQKLGVDTSSFLQLLARASKPSSTTRQKPPISNGRSASVSDVDEVDGVVAPSSKRNGLPVPPRFSSSVLSLSSGGGVALGLGRSFTLRAGVRPNTAPDGLNRLSLKKSPLPGEKSAAVGGGLDWAPRSGLTFSTNVESVIGGSQDGAVSFSSGVGISALNDRVSLVANFSRLQMENVETPSTVAGVNLGVGVSSNVSLNLLYQQLFSTPTPSRSDRVLAGGVSVKF